MIVGITVQYYMVSSLSGRSRALGVLSSVMPVKPLFVVDLDLRFVVEI